MFPLQPVPWNVGRVVTRALRLTPFSFPAVWKQQTRLFLVLKGCSLYYLTHCSLYCTFTANPFLCPACLHRHCHAAHSLSLAQPHTHYAHIFFFLSFQYVVVYYKKMSSVWKKTAGSETKEYMRVWVILHQSALYDQTTVAAWIPSDQSADWSGSGSTFKISVVLSKQRSSKKIWPKMRIIHK